MNLYGRASDDIELNEAIRQCSTVLLQPSAIALLYTPTWCGFAQVVQTNGEIKWCVSPKEKAKFDDVKIIFEARVFSEQAELRWLKHPTHKGRAALVSEEEDISGLLNDAAGTFIEPEPLDQTYLLWGEGAAAKQNDLPSQWSRLAMARIGMLDVPYPLDSGLSVVSKQGERVYLIAREYLAVPDDEPYGNVAVVDERLIKLIDEQGLIAMRMAGLIQLEVL